MAVQTVNDAVLAQGEAVTALVMQILRMLHDAGAGRDESQVALEAAKRIVETSPSFVR